MSYQVLARKYRPQKFSEVIGQEHVTRTLQNAIAQERIAHGYIFSGHRGIGKTTVARILAMALNCRSTVKREQAGGGALRHLRFLHRDSRRKFCRRDRNRRGHQSRHRRNSRTARGGALPSGARPLQNLHSRRSAPDHRRGIQCAAENAGGASQPRHLHDGHDAAGRYSADDPVALPALQLSRDEVR